MVGIYLSQHRPEKALEAYRVATSTYDKMPWVHIAGADAALTLGRSALADSMVRRVDALCARCDYYYRFEARIAQTRGDSGVADSLLARTVRRTVDCIIATFCLTRGHALLHKDRDFDPFEDELGLPVVHP